MVSAVVMAEVSSVKAAGIGVEVPIASVATCAVAGAPSVQGRPAPVRKRSYSSQLQGDGKLASNGVSASVRLSCWHGRMTLVRAA